MGTTGILSVLLFCTLAIITADKAETVEEAKENEAKANEVLFPLLVDQNNFLMTLLYGNETKNQSWTDADASKRKGMFAWTSSQSNYDNKFYDLLLRKLLLSDERSEAAGRTADGGVGNTTRVTTKLLEKSSGKTKHENDKKFLRKKILTVEDWEYPNLTLK